MTMNLENVWDFVKCVSKSWKICIVKLKSKIGIKAPMIWQYNTSVGKNLNIEPHVNLNEKCIKMDEICSWAMFLCSGITSRINSKLRHKVLLETCLVSEDM